MINVDNKNNGFVALFTVLLTSVLLAMAVGIASIALKEIVLASVASEGSNAFYAADSGIECALYYDYNNAISDSMMCNGNTYSPVPTSFVSPCLGCEGASSYGFYMSFGQQDSELCSYITIEKQLTGYNYTTRIESRGSNVACDDLDNPKRVERSIRVTY